MLRVAAWSGAIALAVGTFIVVTHETIVENEGASVDGAILIVLRDRRGGVHRAIGSVGTWAWTAATKNIIEKARPADSR